MAERIDLPNHVIQKALEILRRPESLNATARQLNISDDLLRRNLDRAGLMDEFKGRPPGPRPTRVVAPTVAIKAWDESIANRYLQMKLRHYA